jgi:hypothetical protein
LPSRLQIIFGRWGLPPDDVAWAVFAFGLACVLASFASRDLLESAKNATRARFLAGAGVAAAFLTLGYAAHYLRGGARIVDATTYVLQAKALAHGHLAWHEPWPSASFRGRFLLFEDGHLAGIFPPGWPLLLSIGFILGSPMLVGIALAAALAIATYYLALEANPDEHTREPVARFAALLSIACAALRYHTADPMSHAATALAVTIALVCAMRATSKSVFIAGLAVGYVLCTRPISTIPILLVAIFLLRRAGARKLVAFTLAMLPGLAILLVAQHAATGSFFESTQRAYYATSDGPPDCFRYGFGDGIGCVHEHGDFVRARLAHGFGLLPALGTTIRRLHKHLSDALVAWPLFFAALPACFTAARKSPALRTMWTLVLLQILAYVPFYFDGDYPGAGARFYADILPIEHAAIAISLAAFASRSTALIGLVAIAFGVHGAFDHLSLADRDGGRPMFEPERLTDAHVEAGLLFIDTDHGFALAHDPGVTDPKRGLVVARLRNDNHDRLLFERLGRPTTWAYRFGVGSQPTLLPFTPPNADVAGRELWRFESEVDWPPLAQQGAWAEPIYATGTRQNCPSAGQVLAVHPAPEGEVTIALPIPRAGSWTVRPVVLSRPGDGEVRITIDGLSWSQKRDRSDPNDQPTCVELASQTADFPEGERPVVLHASGGPVALDRVEITPH